MKRKNSSGSVYKLSGNRKRPFRACKTTGWINGKQVQETIGYFKTYKEAEEALDNGLFGSTYIS